MRLLAPKSEVNTMAQVLMIIAQKGFQDKEYEDSRKAIEEAGHTVTVASPSAGEAIGKYDSVVQPDTTISEVDINTYSAIVVIGGPGALTLADHMAFFRLLKLAEDEQKIIGAICIAPRLLAQAGLLKGKQATVWNDDGIQAVFLEQQGARYIDAPTAVDGTIITGNGPDAAKAFGEHIAKALKG